MKEIRYCPFCGGEARPEWKRKDRFVRCKECHAQGPIKKTDGKRGNNAQICQLALDAWNKRELD